MAAPTSIRGSVFFRACVGGFLHKCSPSKTISRYFVLSSRHTIPEKPIAFNTNLLEILVCPVSKQPLRYDQDTNELISDAIGVAYPVRNGIPNLVPTDGRILKDESEKGAQSNEDTPV